MDHFETIWINAKIAKIDDNQQLVVLDNMFLATKDEKIAQIDHMQNFVSNNAHFHTTQIIDVHHKLITPGLIDCHTHLIYGGTRATEFEQRLTGYTYEQLAKAGGGINATLHHTRTESFEQIYHQSAKRLEALIREGVTTLEIKTGYGLDTANEIKVLKVAQKLEEQYPVHIEKTFLGAHCVPPEYTGRSDVYIDYVCEKMLINIHALGLITSVDAYCEKLAFSVEQIRKVFTKAQALGLNVKLHADQFSQMGASRLAATFNALSADHLEYADEAAVTQMAAHNVTAVLLPGAYYFLRETTTPPIDLFRKHNVPIAIASDLNPGTSPLCSLRLMLNMSCVLFGLTITEAFLAVTENAARALGLAKCKGSLTVGYDADFCIWNVSHPRELIYCFQPNVLHYSVKNGKRIVL